MWKIKDIVSRIFHKGDWYILIEILNHYVQVAVLKVSPEKKVITVFKSEFRILSEFNLANALAGAGSLLKKIGKSDCYQIIFSLDSSLATTIYSSISLIRPHPKETIDEADLDNLISQAIWRFFDKQRWRVAQKMGIDDVDVMLSDVRIRDIKIDGHRVVNPIGFRAKTVEISFSQTFLTRDCLRAIRELVQKERVALVTESGTALSHVISLFLDKPASFYVANLFPNETALFSAAGERLAHHDKFDWGGNDLHHSLYRHFRVDPASAHFLLKTYADGNLSQGFLRKFENVLVKELHPFANGLESLVGNDNSNIFLNAFSVFPPIVYSPRFHSRFQKSIKVLPLSTNFITDKLGYTVQFNSSAKVKNEVVLLAAVLEAILLPKNDTVSHLANRRVRWLVT